MTDSVKKPRWSRDLLGNRILVGEGEFSAILAIIPAEAKTGELLRSRKWRVVSLANGLHVYGSGLNYTIAAAMAEAEEVALAGGVPC